MNIAEFINRLYPYLGNGKNKTEFFSSFMQSITDKQEIPFFEMDDDGIRRILNGRRKVSKSVAAYILSNLDEAGYQAIFSDNQTESSAMLLCKEFEEEIGVATFENYVGKLYDLLVKILKQTAYPPKNETAQSRPAIDIEKELSIIVKTIASLTQKEIKDILTYEPTNVEKKISPQNGVLLEEIKNYVTRYYTRVEELFKEIDSSKFDDIAISIKSRSDQLIDQGLPQEEIFNRMVNWLNAKVLNVSELACRVVISFFVQNCEVFHEVP